MVLEYEWIIFRGIFEVLPEFWHLVEILLWVILFNGYFIQLLLPHLSLLFELFVQVTCILQSLLLLLL